MRGLYCTEYDIHELKTTEQALATREQQLRLFTDNIPEPVVYLDGERRYAFVNEAFLDLTGLDARRRSSARRTAEVIGPDQALTLDEYVNRALAGESVTYERAGRRRQRPHALDPRAHACRTSTSTGRSRACTSSATTSPT